MKVDFTKPLKLEAWMKQEKLEPVVEELKKNVYAGVGINKETDERKRNDELYTYFKLFQKLDSATPETEYTPEELTIIKRVASLIFVPGAYGQIVQMIDGKI